MSEGVLFSKAERFRAFLESTDQKENGALYIAALVKSLLAGPQALQVPANPIVFDIGCGEGKMTAFLLTELKRYISDMQLVGVDPSPAMIDLCRQRIVTDNLLPAAQTTLITEAWWNRTDGKAPDAALAQGKGFLAFAIHAHYYAKDVAAAVTSVEESLAPEGCAFFISQAPTSQMDSLRQKYSFSSETNRDSEGQTITTAQVSKSRTHQTDEFTFNSSLWFHANVRQFVETIQFLKGMDIHQADWENHIKIEYQNPDDQKAFICTVNVLEFILRDSIDAMDKARLSEFLNEFVRILDNNKPRTAGENPYLVITEGIVPVPSSPEIQPQIDYAVGSLKKIQPSLIPLSIALQHS